MEAETFLNKSDPESEFLNQFAWGLYKSQIPDSLEFANSWARKAVEKDDNEDWMKLHTLIFILGEQDKWEEAIELAPALVSAAATNDEAIKEVIDFCVSGAANGYAKKILELILESTAADHLEALEVGLRMYLGENLEVAKEILEIGEDVAKRIRELQERP